MRMRPPTLDPDTPRERIRNPKIGDSAWRAREADRALSTAQEVFRNGVDKPVLALDIDGSLGDYHGHFLAFARNYFGRAMPDPAQINRGFPLWQHMEVTLPEYREAKLAYRQGGFKRWMPAYDGAADLTKAARTAGAEVWICTTRPYLRLDNIDPDTREWLRRNTIEYDAVLFDDRSRDGGKYVELVRQVGRSRIVGVLDDLPESLSEAAGNGIRQIWMRDQPYNQHFQPKWADRIFDLWDLTAAVLDAIDLHQKGIAE